MELKDYILKAIKNGEALDLRVESSELEAILEDSLGWMRDDLRSIDEMIDDLKSDLYKKGYIFRSDLEFALYRQQSRILPLYLENVVNKFKKEIASIKNGIIKD